MHSDPAKILIPRFFHTGVEQLTTCCSVGLVGAMVKELRSRVSRPGSDASRSCLLYCCKTFRCWGVVGYPYPFRYEVVGLVFQASQTAPDHYWFYTSTSAALN